MRINAGQEVTLDAASDAERTFLSVQTISLSTPSSTTGQKGAQDYCPIGGSEGVPESLAGAPCAGPPPIQRAGHFSKRQTSRDGEGYPEDRGRQVGCQAVQEGHQGLARQGAQDPHQGALLQAQDPAAGPRPALRPQGRAVAQQARQVPHHQGPAHHRVGHEEDRGQQHARLPGGPAGQQAPDQGRRQAAVRHQGRQGQHAHQVHHIASTSRTWAGRRDHVEPPRAASSLAVVLIGKCGGVASRGGLSTWQPLSVLLCTVVLVDATNADLCLFVM
ncbi:unnamed protein product [Phytophthora fragariaefolia]|uniref:Unnamed protein product n=1 Tax=Phytophthora fragariaefolia TaxID=1490495 RepID=A0A9W6XTX0_9STRA|nr:unnamed protein product [Phytophthora fragariaefolia]